MNLNLNGIIYYLMKCRAQFLYTSDALQVIGLLWQAAFSDNIISVS